MDNSDNTVSYGSSEKNTGSAVERNLILKDIEELPLAEYEDVRTVNISRAIESHDSIEVQILKLLDSDSQLNIKTEMNEMLNGSIDFKKLQKIIYVFSGNDFSGGQTYSEWEHSYSCSLLMKTMIDENQLPVSASLQMAALMHDIGKIFLKKQRPQKYKVAESYSREKRIPLHLAENIFLKITHAEIGGLLMEKLGMPEEICWPVKLHHNKDVPERYILEVALLKFADWVDSSLRKDFCTSPEANIMNAAGIESIDIEYWINRHREISASVHSNYFCDSSTRRLKRAIRKEAERPCRDSEQPGRESAMTADMFND